MGLVLGGFGFVWVGLRFGGVLCGFGCGLCDYLVVL